jgi:hypothetical protein
MRLNTRFQRMNMRIAKVAMWRADIRDLVGLTETKMDNYLLANTIQLALVVALYTEGRFEPGTPEWMCILASVSLTGSTVFFLLSSWFALHASNAAKAYGVRLLTQFVRYPVPSLQDVEASRTFGQDWETMNVTSVGRVPFLMKGHTETKDPYGLEGPLDEMTAELREEEDLSHARHIELFREAQLFWECYDAFARVSMAGGTVQLLYATSYYLIGYLLLQDAAIWAAWSGAAVFMTLVLALLHLDLALTNWETVVGTVAVITGPLSACIAAALWGTYQPFATKIAKMLVPWAFTAHTVVVLLALHVLGVRRSPRGLYLPLRFRSALYLDVFGWFTKEQHTVSRDPLTEHGITMMADHEPEPAPPEPAEDKPPLQEEEKEYLLKQEQERRVGDALFSATNPEVLARLESHQREKVLELQKAVGGRVSLDSEAPTSPGGKANPNWVKLEAETDTGTTMPYYYNPETKETETKLPPGVVPVSLSFTLQEAEELKPKAVQFDEAVMDDSGMGPAPNAAPRPLETAFGPDSFGGVQLGNEDPAAGQKVDAAKYPWDLFRWNMLVFAWLWGSAALWGFSGMPTLPVVPLTAVDKQLFEMAKGKESKSTPLLYFERRVDVDWPAMTFRPVDLSCDSNGQFMVVSDDFQIYTADAQTHHFSKLICGAVRGEALRDVGVQCAPSGDCYVLVLHKKGRQISKCPVGNTAMTVTGNNLTVAESWLRDVGYGGQVALQATETVSSVAADSVCPDCVVVGTTHGRLVRMQKGVFTQKLVPLAPVRGVKEAPSSLHVTTSGIVLSLHPKKRTLEATTSDGRHMGAWKIPNAASTDAAPGWTGVCATAQHVYLLGTPSGGAPELWQFTTPQLIGQADLAAGAAAA